MLLKLNVAKCAWRDVLRPSVCLCAYSFVVFCAVSMFSMTLLPVLTSTRNNYVALLKQDITKSFSTYVSECCHGLLLVGDLQSFAMNEEDFVSRGVAGGGGGQSCSHPR
jgi:hypothetical protein